MLAKNLPETVLDKSWPAAPTSLVEVTRHQSRQGYVFVIYNNNFFINKLLLKASQQLQTMYMQHMVRKYVKTITPQRKQQVNKLEE